MLRVVRAADQGEFELEEDDELNVTEEELCAEEAEEPEMMLHAKYWDNFLDLIRETQRPWAKAEDDTDDYRKGRALNLFNLSAPLI